MSVPDTLIRAIELQGQGQPEAAAGLFREVLTLDPANGAALYSLALIALNAGDRTQELKISEGGVASAPTFAPLHYLHGTVLQALGRNDEALQSYDRAIELKPDYTEVMLNSGALLRTMFRHHDALA